MTIDRAWLDDEVTITLTEQNETRRCKEYSVKCSVFQQPSAFQLTTGDSASLAADLVAKHGPGDPFALRIQRMNTGSDFDVALQTGRLDAADIPESDETVVELRGRDNLAALWDDFFVQEDSFTEATFFDLTAKQLKAVGFDPDLWLLTGDEARRKAVTNATAGMVRSGSAPVRMGTTTVQEFDLMWAWKPATGGGASLGVVGELSAPRADNPSTDAKEVQVEGVTGGQPTVEIKTLKALVGRRRYEWLKEQYKRAGLFLWTMPSGHFMLSTPNTSQEPVHRLTRIVDGSPRENNILSGGLRNDTTQRFAHTLVFGRAGGGKDGRRRIVGRYTDAEMIDKYRLIKRIAYDEADIKTQKAADYLAKRYAADARRNSRSLVYTVSGHSAIALDKPGQRRPWFVDSMVHVIDQKTGIDGDFYLGDIEFKRSMSEGTITRLTLYWPEDLVFAEEAA
jgi:hypothetical protein